MFSFTSSGCLLQCLVFVLLLLALSLSSSTVGASASGDNDVTVLNYALTLEHLEAAFYDQGLAKFSSSNFSSNFTYDIYPYLQMVQAHEASHVAFLVAAINNAKAGAAVQACTYNFSSALETPMTFLETAMALENGGQQAYAGAINRISNPAYARAAAQIASVEARHAAYLNQLLGTSPFPAAFDTATVPATIATIIAPFIVSCPYNITLPTIRPSGVALNSSNHTVATGSNSPVYSVAQKMNDIVALNYALTLENFESAFYQYALTTFSYQDFIDAGNPSYYYNYTVMIAGHEELHATTLTTVINGRVSGAAVPVCIYNFSTITTVAQYLSVAMLLENTGVYAYDGAVNTITDTNLQQVAATIATVEARHAAFLNFVNSTSPFPMAFDNATLPADIIKAVLATGFITSCPYSPVGPVVITNNGTVNNGTINDISSSSTGAYYFSSTGSSGASAAYSSPIAALIGCIALAIVLA